MSVKDVDKGFRSRLASLKKSSSAVVKVGVFEREGAKAHKGRAGRDQLTVLLVATFQEFGLGVPERSFIRGYVDKNEARIRKMLSVVLENVAKGRYDLETGLNRLGHHVVGEIQQRIARKGDGDYPELAASTIKAKGSDVPLIDTGQLRASISHKVEL